MNEPRLTRRAAEEMDQIIKLRNECVDILGLVVAEWTTDPKSVECFDLRMVERAKLVIASLKKLEF